MVDGYLVRGLTFSQIIDRYCKEHGIRIRGYFKTEEGEAFLESREIRIPHLTSPDRFIVALHEIGHIVNAPLFERHPIHVVEFMTEKWAIREARKWDIQSDRYERLSRYYIVEHMSRAFNRGVPIGGFSRRMREWTQYDFSAWVPGKKVEIDWTDRKISEEITDL